MRHVGRRELREATRARSPAEFASVLHISLRECEETAFWLELLVEGDIVPAAQLAALRGEVDESTAMLVASINTAKKNADR